MSLYEEILKLPEEYVRVLLFFKHDYCTIHPPINSELASPELLNNCFNYHSNEDFRRPLFDPEYSTLMYVCNETPCSCKNLAVCKNAHTSFEINFHPMRYKTISCLNFKTCLTPKALCPFLHESEVGLFQGIKSFLKNGQNIAKYSLPLLKNLANFTQTPTLHLSSKPTIKLVLEKVNLNFEYPEKMVYFKVELCPILNENHNWNKCQFHHNDKDRRRVIGNYSAERCYLKQCPKGDNCEFSHNDPEQLYHPDKYKKRFCSLYPHDIANCKFGDFCSFAHAENELRIIQLDKLEHNDEFNLFYYKTIWCPKNCAHGKAECVYAHNVQDFRRSPLEYFYDQDECKYWCKIDNKNKYEKGGCNKMLECNKCHGWKESEYHPFNYKKWKCTLGDTCKKKECAYLHSFDNKILIKNLIDIYVKKKTRHATNANKGVNKDIKNKTFGHPKIENSNFKQPILTFDQQFFPLRNDDLKLINKEKIQTQKNGFMSQKQSSRGNSLEFGSEDTSNESFEKHKISCYSKPPGFLSDSHDEKKAYTGKTTKASLSRDSSVFIPGFNHQGQFFTPTPEGNSIKGENGHLPLKCDNDKYMSCPCTPDNPKLECNKINGNGGKNYELFEKKTFFSDNFKRKFQDLNLLSVLDKFLNNLMLEDNVKALKKQDIEKLDFLSIEEKNKVNLLLNEIKGEGDV